MTRTHTAPTAKVISLAEHRQARLSDLQTMRERTAITAVEHDAHGLDDAAYLLTQQCVIEETIRELDPDLYRENWPGWVEDDARRMHNPAHARHPECSICQAAATPHPRDPRRAA